MGGVFKGKAMVQKSGGFSQGVRGVDGILVAEKALNPVYNINSQYLWHLSAVVLNKQDHRREALRLLL